MGCRRMVFGWLGAGLVWLAASPGPAPGQAAAPGPRLAAGYTPVRVPLDQLPAGVRERVRGVLERPTLSAHGPVEGFNCQPPFYLWLLEHPDQAVRLWRALGARCTDIEDQGGGRFGWRDAQGSEVHWDTVLRAPRQRIWYAEGRVKTGALVPSVPVQAVVVLDHAEGHDRDGRPGVRHQMHLVLHTDSRLVALATRMFGPSAPRMLEQFVGQMEMFFGALAWYADKHPDRLAPLLGQGASSGAATGRLDNPR